MFSYKHIIRLRAALTYAFVTRNKGNVADPVQQLFLDKVREYRSRSPNDQFVEPSQAIVKELEKELGKLEKNFGGGPGIDMTAFPTFKFEEPNIDPIDEVIPEKAKKRKTKHQKQRAVKKADKPQAVKKTAPAARRKPPKKGGPKKPAPGKTPAPGQKPDPKNK